MFWNKITCGSAIAFSDFPKDYKRHEKRRDEENRMKDELSKYKTEIIKPSKLGIFDSYLEFSFKICYEPTWTIKI